MTHWRLTPALPVSIRQNLNAYGAGEFRSGSGRPALLRLHCCNSCAALELELSALCRPGKAHATCGPSRCQPSPTFGHRPGGCGGCSGQHFAFRRAMPCCVQLRDWQVQLRIMALLTVFLAWSIVEVELLISDCLYAIIVQIP